NLRGDVVLTARLRTWSAIIDLRLRLIFDARRLRHQSPEPPRQNLTHHAEVVARCEVFRSDVELAVLVLAEAFRARDDHGANGVAALDVRVVVDLDAARRPSETEGLAECGEQVLLRLRLGELAAERLARIGERVLDQILLLAALRQRDFDLVAAL